MNNKFTDKSKNTLEYARISACELGHTYIGSEHILLGLLYDSKGVTPASKILNSCGVEYANIRARLISATGKGEKTALTSTDFSPRVKRIIERSYTEAVKNSQSYIGTEHLLLAMCMETDSVAAKLILAEGSDMETIYRYTNAFIKNMSYMDLEIELPENTLRQENMVRQKKKNTPHLNQYSRDITEEYFLGKIDPVIGRNDEIERVVRVLSRRNKNNPCLIGEPGVGKTAIAEGIASLICEGKAPDTISGKRIVSLNLSLLISGAKYRGEFEERLKLIIEEILKSGDIILLIDEIHNIVGAGAAEGAIDAANILKPLLARDELRVIGATTLKEYRKYIEKDSALERRFQPIYVNEPSQEDAVKILFGLRDKYEAYHKIKISDSAVYAAVKYSVRYMTERFLPDKAIDLIDEACAKIRIELQREPSEMKKLAEDILSAGIQKNEAIQAQMFESARVLRDKEIELKRLYNQKKTEYDNSLSHQETVLEEEDIAKIITIHTGIPVSKLIKSDSERLNNIENLLREKVIGQEKAVGILAGSILRNRLGIRDPKRPSGSYIFIGPSGVGKTQLAKTLADILFGDMSKLVKIDMSEYMEKHSMSRMIGSPPGYVGYDDAGQLTEKVRRTPYCVVLFDEIEKAHPDILNLLLQILEDGELTDSQGRKINFRNTIIIMTSNIGSGELSQGKTPGFHEQKNDVSQIEGKIHKKLKETLKPELIGRIDEIIVFRHLEEADIDQVTRLILKETLARMEGLGLRVTVSDEVISALSKEGYSREYGVRNIRKVIQTKIEDLVASQYIKGEIGADDEILLAFDREKKLELRNINKNLLNRY